MEGEIEISFEEAKEMGFEDEDLELMEEELEPEVEDYEEELQENRNKVLSIDEAMHLGMIF